MELNLGRELYNRSMRSLLLDNNIKIYLAHNEGKSVFFERLVRTLKNKIYKYMTSISKNMHINKLCHKVNKYNNTYHSTIKMKPLDIELSTYFDFDVKNNKKYPKFEVGDHVRISKYKGGYAPSWSEEAFMIKNTVTWTYD